MTVDGVEEANAVTVGGGHACALSSTGEVWCWGRNEAGQTGSEVSYEPAARELVGATRVPGVHAKSVVAVRGSTCAETIAGRVACWGGLRVPDDSGVEAVLARRPFELEGLGGVDSIAGEGETYCAVSGGAALCWGDVQCFVSGARVAVSPARVEGLPDLARVAVGSEHACALARDGRVWCWGRNTKGQLGRGAASLEDAAVDESTFHGCEAPPLAPEPVPDVMRAVALSVHGALSCAVTDYDEVLCWGRWPGPDGAVWASPTPIPVW
jgi:alpha-tubulin suppressor-like RCC1 family protein